jgi:molecular chaperone GrpE
MAHEDKPEAGSAKAREISVDESATSTAGKDGGAASPEVDAAAEMERLRREAAENYDRFLRERADVENFKRRMQREKAEAIRFATEPLVRDLLPVVDNLERALEHCADADASVREGVEMVLKSLLDVLARHNIKRIQAEGQGFDPSLHEAIAQAESHEHQPNAVLKEHQVGYLLNERLLRPALVTVNTRKPATDAVERGQDSD